MITGCKDVVSVNGTKTEIISDLIAIFLGLISEGQGHAVAAAIGFCSGRRG